MYAWLAGPGAVFKEPSGEPQYISSFDRNTWERKDRARAGPDFVTPYPHNRVFKSQPVLSDAFRDEIYRRVVVQGDTVRQVSAQLNVSIERVAAVARLKAVEKKWVDSGRRLSTFLTKALDEMLPISHPPKGVGGVLEGKSSPSFENVQDLPAHSLAGRQAFVPVSESREFTRVDAGKEFGLPPADEMVPHPDLVVLATERIVGVFEDERIARQEERDRLARSRWDAEREKAEARKRATTVKEAGRWKWCLKEAEVGKVGFRYGFPLPDRKKGHVKIPTHVT
jgi:hypothetical protein